MDDIIELQRRKIMLLGNDNLNNLVNKMIKLRALRVIYDTIKNVSSGYVKAGDPSDAIYIRTSKTGGLTTR